MNFVLNHDIMIVRNKNKMPLADLAKKVGFGEQKVKERIDFLYSDSGKRRLVHVEDTIRRQALITRRYKVRRSEMRIRRTNNEIEICMIRAFNEMLLLPSPPTVPIKTQHIDTPYIKGALQLEYLAMRERGNK